MISILSNTISTIIFYLIIPVIGNLVYYFAFDGVFTSCSVVCLIFFNIAFLSLFLPYLTKENKEKYQTSGQRLLASSYLIIETIIAILFIVDDSDAKSAFIIQLIMLGLFLFLYLGINRANRVTNKSLENYKRNESQPLLMALKHLRFALCNTDIDNRQIIHSAIVELSSIPLTASKETIELDNSILDIIQELCKRPSYETVTKFNNLVYRRKTFTFSH